MTRRQRLRRTGLLCLHCLRNLAFHRAAHDARRQWVGQQFWVTTHNNFLDVAVLEWCKVFGDVRAKHYWRKTITNQEAFLSSLLDHIRLTEPLFAEYVIEIRTYRDKFIAHLDEEERMNIPNMALAIKSAQFLYLWMLREEDDCNAFWDAPTDPATFFRGFMTEAHETYMKSFA